MAGAVSVIIPAAGSGQRLGGGTPKALRTSGGRTLLEHAIRSVVAHPDVAQVVLAMPPTAPQPPALELDAELVAVPGGSSRQQSVAAALRAVAAECDIVLVHDAARPLVPRAVLARVIEAVREGAPCAIPGLPVVDTIKVVDEDGYVVQTPPRAMLRAVQTPQGFAADVLRLAHRRAPDPHGATDDASLVELLGLPVRVVAGDPLAAKITTAADLEWLGRVLAEREAE